MMDFILAEKPSAAKAIARALGQSKRKRFKGRVYYYVVDNNKVVCSAVGHLFNLYPKVTKRGIFPKWETQWVASWKVNSKLSYLKDYYECIRSIVLNNEFDRYIIATDLDIEGTVIGFITFATLKVPFSKVYRMKMNSLARDEIRRAYNELEPPDVKWFNAGWARHEVDLLWGINLSEAFSTALSNFRERWKTISLGRVQSPTLKFVVDREREIRNFKPEKYWLIEAELLINDEKYTVTCDLGSIKDSAIVRQILSECKAISSAKVLQITKTIKTYPPPHLFSLPTLQQEAWRFLRFTPDFTDKLAQSLYQQALISYPRTGSTSIAFVPYKNILQVMSKGAYSNFVTEILTNNWSPRKGGYYDGAHTAIYPTPELRNPKTDYESKLLDLIKRRFLAIFYPDAKRLHCAIKFMIGRHSFSYEGQVTIDKGWTRVYKFRQFSDTKIPSLNEGDEVKVIEVRAVERETKPPPRYSFASLVREMERHNIGTKATRASICKILWLRGYIHSEKGVGIKPNPLGERLVEIAEKFVPEIVNVKLTSELEKQLEAVEKGELSRNEVVQKCKIQLVKILNEISHNLPYIGEELLKAELQKI